MEIGPALPIAHRGAHGPGRAENSPAAVRHALDLGVRAVEFDVHQLGDGALVAWHDDDVPSRGVGGEAPHRKGVGGKAPRRKGADGRRRRAHELTLADVALPRVEELLDLVRQADVFVVFDWKSVGAEARIAGLLRELGLADRTLVSSVYPAALAALGNERLRTGLSFPADAYGQLPDLVDTMALLLDDAGASAAMVDYRLATPDVLASLRGRGLDLFLWTAADAQQYRALRELGPDGIMTDAIEDVLAAERAAQK
jgi:glycerophosphoryl diester phosphodiesterase